MLTHIMLWTTYNIARIKDIERIRERFGEISQTAPPHRPAEKAGTLRDLKKARRMQPGSLSNSKDSCRITVSIHAQTKDSSRLSTLSPRCIVYRQVEFMAAGLEQVIG